MKDSKTSKSTTVKESQVGRVTETGAELGSIKIHENVYTTLARKATIGVEGVSRLAVGSLIANIADFVGSRKGHDRSIQIEIEENSVKIEVRVNVAFGFSIPEIAAGIQTAVKDDVKKCTGVEVSKVDVIVQKVEEEQGGEEDEEEGEE